MKLAAAAPPLLYSTCKDAIHAFRPDLAPQHTPSVKRAYAALCDQWSLVTAGELLPLTAEEARAFFDPAQPPMVAARTAVSESAQRELLRRQAHGRKVIMLLSAPVDEARVLAEAAKQPMRYAWDDAVALFRPDLHDRSAWAAYWYLRNQWPFKANGDASVMTFEEARAFFDPAQPPMVAARVASESERAHSTYCRTLERQTLELLSAPAEDVASGDSCALVTASGFMKE